jgi:hypothetical protein
MTYAERTTEWAPHPDKAEHIFIAVCVKEAFAKGFIEKDEYRRDLEQVVIDSAAAWQGAQATLRKTCLNNARQMMGFAENAEGLKAEAVKIASIPQTSTERETTLEIYRTRKRELEGQSNPHMQAPPVSEDEYAQRGHGQ